MTKKKPTKRPRKSSKPKSNISPNVVDRRALEKTTSDLVRLLSQHRFASAKEANAFLQQLLGSGGPIPSSPRTPLDQAQDIMYEAWDAAGKRRVELARQALAVSEDCADAYVLLAEETATNPDEARNLYEQGVKAGERALGARAFEEDVGHFWGILETRPYMRARLGLANGLWWLGERAQAIEHYAELLRLNPGDNQGVRYILANCLLQESSDEAVGKLLEQFADDASATWLYNRALWVFRREGASDEANKRIKAALEQNRFVPLYLLGAKRLPKRMPDYVGYGDENEAVDYAAAAIPVWHKTEGAVEWLKGNLPVSLPPKR